MNSGRKSIVSAGNITLNDTAVLTAIEDWLAMLRLDAQGVIIWANERASSEWGYEFSEIIGSSYEKLCSAAYGGSSEYHELWERLRRGISVRKRVHGIHKEGYSIYHNSVFMPIMDGAGRVSGFINMVTNTDLHPSEVQELNPALDQGVELLLKRAESNSVHHREIEDIMGRVIQNFDGHQHSLDVLKERINAMRDILRLIHEIASRTNLLALNAAIEAAHAGDYGRGFSIVVNEVKKLSQQSAEALKNVNINLGNLEEQIRDITDRTVESQWILTSRLALLKQANDEIAAAVALTKIKLTK